MDADLTPYERVALGLPPSKLKPFIVYFRLAFNELIWELRK